MVYILKLIQQKYFLKIKNIFLIFILISFWFLFYLTNLDVPHLTFGESRRVAIAYDIDNLKGFFSADYIGEFYSNKPPVFSFILSLFLKYINGSIEFASRLPSALFVLLISLVSFFNLNWLDKKSAFFVSFYIIISPLSIHYGRKSEIDFLYASIFFLSLLDILSYFESCKNNKNIIRFSLYQSLAFIIKGPLSLFLSFGFVIYNCKSVKEILIILKTFIPIFIFIILSYFSYAIFSNSLSFKTLLIEIYIRFVDYFHFIRFSGERLITISFLVPYLILLIMLKNISFNKNIFLINRFCFSIILLLFLLPGYQVGYSLPLILFSTIPTGILLSSGINFQINNKINILVALILVCNTFYVFSLPLITNFYSNFDSQKDLIIKALNNNISKEGNQNIDIFLDENTKYIAPYLYDSNEKFKLFLFSNKNINDYLNSYSNKKFFILSQKNINENNNYLYNLRSCKNKNQIIKSKVRRKFINWPYAPKKDDQIFYNLFEISKCN